MGSSLKKSKQVVVAFMIFIMLTLSVSPIFPKKAEAFVFFDPGNFGVNIVTSIGTHAIWIKEYALDAVAYNIINLIIQRMAASTVNWINGGFRGSPAFVTDPGQYFGGLSDKIAGQFIFNDPKLNFLCGPIKAKIRLTLTNNYINDNQNWQCTLTQVGRNMEDFLGDFENGGWDSFFELTQRPQNNPIGAYLRAENELNLQIATRVGLKERELNWSNGFMSFKVCKQWADKSDYSESLLELDKDILPDSPQDPSGQRICIKEETSTPGAVIENRLNGVLGIGDQRLAVSDEINEIISALINQLTSRIVGGIGSGLRSLSSPDSSGSSFTGQISNTSNDASINTYFNTSQQNVTNALTQPTPNVYFCRDNPNAPECVGTFNSATGGQTACNPADLNCLNNTP